MKVMKERHWEGAVLPQVCVVFGVKRSSATRNRRGGIQEWADRTSLSGDGRKVCFDARWWKGNRRVDLASAHAKRHRQILVRT